MDSAEFADWMIYHALEPFGSPTEDGRAGVIATAAYSAWGGRRAPDEWFSRYAPPPADPTEDLKDVLAGLRARQAASEGMGAD